jgi:hypothetical protein
MKQHFNGRALSIFNSYTRKLQPIYIPTAITAFACIADYNNITFIGFQRTGDQRRQWSQTLFIELVKERPSLV